MKDFPAREKLDLASMVSQYLVIASTLDKGSPPEDYDQANELSLELAMLLPASVYRAMTEAAANPDGKINPAVVALLMRREFGVTSADAADELQTEQVAFHAPGAVAPRPRQRAH